MDASNSTNANVCFAAMKPIDVNRKESNKKEQHLPNHYTKNPGVESIDTDVSENVSWVVYKRILFRS